MNNRKLIAYCGLLDEQRAYENAYKFKSIPHPMAVEDE
jgi:hypothetical protein